MIDTRNRLQCNSSEHVFCASCLSQIIFQCTCAGLSWFTVTWHVSLAWQGFRFVISKGVTYLEVYLTTGSKYNQSVK